MPEKLLFGNSVQMGSGREVNGRCDGCGVDLLESVCGARLVLRFVAEWRRRVRDSANNPRNTLQNIGLTGGKIQ